MLWQTLIGAVAAVLAAWGVLVTCLILARPKGSLRLWLLFEYLAMPIGS